MILVADSGSTKTTWVSVETGNKIVTEGLNPHFTNDETILAACNSVRSQLTLPPSPVTIHLYGSGCGNKQQAMRMKTLLQQGFNSDNVIVETDMLGACRAVSPGRASVVAILGTGSNVCYFDGSEIKCQPTSTGFILGDKGSANHIGRILLNDYLTHRMPDELRNTFLEDFQMSDADFIDAVYHRPNPNRFLASLAPFAVRNKDNAYCSSVVRETLEQFYQDSLTVIRERSRCHKSTLCFVGGLAKALESEIRQFFAAKGEEVSSVVADPINGLVEYHRIKNS